MVIVKNPEIKEKLVNCPGYDDSYFIGFHLLVMGLIYSWSYVLDRSLVVVFDFIEYFVKLSQRNLFSQFTLVIS